MGGKDSRPENTGIEELGIVERDELRIILKTKNTKHTKVSSGIQYIGPKRKTVNTRNQELNDRQLREEELYERA